ncbi:MAG: 16S rRNA (cytosine(967)-C(5))-methyltransferase RsmB, partial [Steroidobacteraceae bacterium]
ALAGAARAVGAVVSRGNSSDAALAGSEAGADRAAVRAIALGTLRWYLRLKPPVEALLSRPSHTDPGVHALLVTAAHQIEYSRNAPELTVHAAVDAARMLGLTGSTGLVNAVLRRIVGERAALFKSVDSTLAGRTAHPPWLAERIDAAWPRQVESILTANNEHPPMVLRVDLSRGSTADYRAMLASASIESREIQWMPGAVSLDRPVAVRELPGFAEGLVSVQDAGAQLAASLLAARPGMRVLDACAAPGGKTAHVLERLGEGADVTAVDIDPERLGRVAENLARLKRRARLVVGDARRPETFWDGKPFERILVDAPCSSTGVIRRHPDIKLLRRPGDIEAFSARQLEILTASVGLLAPGGRLVYSTCSVLPEENAQVVHRLLRSEPALQVAFIPRGEEFAPGALDCDPGVQLLPGSEARTDGFYYACLEKTTTGT